MSTQLYSAREKQQLASLVGTMLAYSLTYRQDRTPDGSTSTGWSRESVQHLGWGCWAPGATAIARPESEGMV